jgi:hypothetical protein
LGIPHTEKVTHPDLLVFSQRKEAGRKKPPVFAYWQKDWAERVRDFPPVP